MNGLKQKLAFSYGLLIIVIFAVSAWSIYHMVTLGRAIDVILVNNYKSILAAENMKEALERQDSAVMFFIAGHPQNAREQFETNRQKFANEFEIAANNITEPGEAEIVDDIRTKYQTYGKDLEGILARSQSGELSNFYFQRLAPEFLAIKDKLDELLHLNQRAMVAANDRAVSVARRAEISTAVTAALAL